MTTESDSAGISQIAPVCVFDGTRLETLVLGHSPQRSTIAPWSGGLAALTPKCGMPGGRPEGSQAKIHCSGLNGDLGPTFWLPWAPSKQF